AFGSDEAHNKNYTSEILPQFLTVIEQLLNLSRQGPYLPGKVVSYGDFYLATIVHDSKYLSLNDYPRVK
ncbi:hypothetical protein THASP1DRAFT_9791, partial [Thamnocephalis sphaerospora]